MFDKEGESKKYYKCLKCKFYKSSNLFNARTHVSKYCKGETKKNLKGKQKPPKHGFPPSPELPSGQPSEKKKNMWTVWNYIFKVFL